MNLQVVFRIQSLYNDAKNFTMLIRVHQEMEILKAIIWEMLTDYILINWLFMSVQDTDFVDSLEEVPTHVSPRFPDSAKIKIFLPLHCHGLVSVGFLNT